MCHPLNTHISYVKLLTKMAINGTKCSSGLGKSQQLIQHTCAIFMRFCTFSKTNKTLMELQGLKAFHKFQSRV